MSDHLHRSRFPVYRKSKPLSHTLTTPCVSDVRVAQQFGFFVILPLGVIYVAGELDIIPLGDAGNLLIIAGILFLVDLLLLVARATFCREEILTKWK